MPTVQVREWQSSEKGGQVLGFALDGCDEAIALFGQGVDESGAGSAVIQDGTNLTNAEVEALVDVDVDAGAPDVVA